VTLLALGAHTEKAAEERKRVIRMEGGNQKSEKE